MADLEQLRRSVDATLNKARQRTAEEMGTLDRRRSVHPSTASERLETASLARTIEEQRVICEELRQELEDLVNRRQQLDATIERGAAERLELEQQVEMIGLKTELTRRRRQDLEKQLTKLQKELQEARQGRREMARSVLKTRDLLQRISDKLGNVG